jgi:hypothetical protein
LDNYGRQAGAALCKTSVIRVLGCFPTGFTRFHRLHARIRSDTLLRSECPLKLECVPGANVAVLRPDLRLEYETPELELRHVDLELATRDYRPRAMAEKATAGFSLYGCHEDVARLRRVLDEREIIARILTL